jgi:hypothetical protein
MTMATEIVANKITKLALSDRRGPAEVKNSELRRAAIIEKSERPIQAITASRLDTVVTIRPCSGLRHTGLKHIHDNF